MLVKILNFEKVSSVFFYKNLIFKGFLNAFYYYLSHLKSDHHEIWYVGSLRLPKCHVLVETLNFEKVSSVFD